MDGSQGAKPKKLTLQSTCTGALCQAVLEKYPDMLVRTYLVPPLHFNRVPYTVQTVAGQLVFVSISETTEQEIFSSDVHDDVSKHSVRQGLQRLVAGRQEAMFIISGLKYHDYLSLPDYAEETKGLTRPKNGKGEFDLLAVHLKYGMLVGKISCVVGSGDWGHITTRDDDVGCAVLRMAKKLTKQRELLLHLFHDVAARLTVRCTLCLPHVSRQQLVRVLQSEGSRRQAVCKCLGAADAEGATLLCICSDELTHLASSEAVPSEMDKWFERRMACTVDSYMSRDVYINIVARLCGPATQISVYNMDGQRVEIPTEADAVLATGRSMSIPVLSQHQVELLNHAAARQFLTGPPGTGKSRTLYMMADYWLQQGHAVHVLSTSQRSRAVSILLADQLEGRVREMSTDPSVTPGRVIHLHKNIGEEDDPEDVIKVLKSAQPLHVIADEAGPGHADIFQNFCDELAKTVPDVHLWAATVFHELRPQCLEEKRLTIPRRCPPVVQREVDKTQLLQNRKIYEYSRSDVPPPTDGPAVKWLSHSGQPGHCKDPPEDCEECGRNIADVLKGLNVGKTPSVPAEEGEARRLQYRHVFIVCSKPEEDSGVVRGLKSRGIPVRVVTQWSPDDVVRDMALAVSDVVTVADATIITGLERMIVVGMGFIGRMSNRGLLIKSRCTAQLVWVDPEPDFTARDTEILTWQFLHQVEVGASPSIYFNEIIYEPITRCCLL